ncbi:SDR family oxidoreductase [Canibacter zhoujuaniae]|uniref:SDR family oxidoreductase n=1 Tax=Canibacter zhoujuaniae TaxID=2708343 RepID=UPI0014233E26|nr:SDR family oxidoreductase [Canibacter zhoujuaniae]
MALQNNRPVAVITGASRGIGLATATLLAESFHLVLVARNAELLQKLAADFPSAQYFVADLASAADTAKLVAQLQQLDRIDALVHSAAVIGYGPIAAVDEEAATSWQNIFAVNVTAVAQLTAGLLPQLRQSHGTVVAVNSGAGLNAGSNYASYAASKFALKAVTDSLRAEEAPNGVRVTSVHPGRVATDMQKQLRAAEHGEYHAADYLQPETVAAAIQNAILAPAAASVDMISVRPL